MVFELKPFDAIRANPNEKKRVAYFYDADVGNYAYGAGHPMKPHRIRMAHSLIMNYGLYKKMEIYRAKPATREEMCQFHTDEYVDFLSRVTPDNLEFFQKEQAKFNVGDDCPVFDGLFEYCGISGGGSMEGAARLNRGKCEVAINYAGGLHHAKKSEASGFCYVNDIVLGIIELLRYHPRVLYIDIDVHHGDGVEEAFYTTDRVMTCSFHKYGEFFPGTGDLRDIGVSKGKYHAVNVPLRDGIDDTTYKNLFEPVITHVVDWYQPSAIVLQCGGDSLSGDRLGCFNLSMNGHANCVNFVKSFNLPMMVVGGGGYTMRNVARTWCYETGILNNEILGPDLPYNDYYEYYGPDYKLDVRPSNMLNANTPEYCDKLLIQLIKNLEHTQHAPSVQMQHTPRDLEDLGDVDEDTHEAMDTQGGSQYARDNLVQPSNEFYEDDHKVEGVESKNITNNESSVTSSDVQTLPNTTEIEKQPTVNHSVSENATTSEISSTLPAAEAVSQSASASKNEINDPSGTYSTSGTAAASTEASSANAAVPAAGHTEATNAQASTDKKDVETKDVSNGDNVDFTIDQHSADNKVQGNNEKPKEDLNSEEKISSKPGEPRVEIHLKDNGNGKIQINDLFSKK